MSIKYPLNCIASNDKIEFCYIALEKLRLEHNAKGKDYREGKINNNEWEIYLNIDFNPKQELIVADILKQKTALKASTKYNVDLTKLEE